jgi:hypothetical protein
LCDHNIAPGSGAVQAQLSVVTDSCDGPVVLITASYVFELAIDGLRPGPLPDPSLAAPAISDLAFNVSTLKDLRALFCSEGLISAPFFGQDTAQPLGTYFLAYEVEGTEAVLFFTLTLPQTLRYQPPENITSDQRDTATVQNVNLAIRPLIDIQLQELPRPSPNYIPLPADILDDPANLPDCTTS